MKDFSIFKNCLSIIAFLVVTVGFPQTNKTRVSFGINVLVERSKVRLYKMDDPDKNEHVKTVVLRMGYGDSDILNPGDASLLEEGGCNIISVDLVYTEHEDPEFQDHLNKKRLAELYFISPDIFDQKMTNWRYIEQLGFRNEEDARKLFHGFVIKYIKVPFYTPSSKEAMLGDLVPENLSDTSLYPVFEKQIDFNDELICVDLTGSMSPYYLQVFVWLNLKMDGRYSNYAFFNDGDQTPDFRKRTGKVGGVYVFRSNSMDTITSHAFNCITNGSGGDTPENNIEAIVKGIEHYPDSKEVVILVDNWADMRDYAHIGKIKKPVKVIVCGTQSVGFERPLNPQYLDLARRTGGSLHTIEEDILDLSKKKEGDVITVGRAEYILRGGRFIKR